jgi:hypothetical protein
MCVLRPGQQPPAIQQANLLLDLNLEVAVAAVLVQIVKFEKRPCIIENEAIRNG